MAESTSLFVPSSAPTRDTRMRKSERDGEQERWGRSGRPLRRRNSKAGTYASFIKEIASKDCCFAHGYVSWHCLASLQPRSLAPTQPSSLLCRCRCSRHSNYGAFIFNLFLEITICWELARQTTPRSCELPSFSRTFRPSAIVVRLVESSVPLDSTVQNLYVLPKIEFELFTNIILLNIKNIF